MKRFITLFIYLATLTSLSLQAQEGVYERAYLHTDKSCYLAGEDVWVKFYVTDTQFRPSSLSKVGYVEISGTERPVAQVKVALDGGSGWGKISIPAALSSGVYQLTAYTRYMRNEGDSLFFRKQIAIINAFRSSPDDRMEQPDSTYRAVATKTGAQHSVSISTDKQQYGQRRPVSVTITGLPAHVADLTLSVVCNDSLACLPPVDNEAWRAQVTAPPQSFSGKWIPEYEGHIIPGKVSTTDGKGEVGSSNPLPSLAFVGKNIRYIQGQTNAERNVSFYTGKIYGTRELVLYTRSEVEGGCRTTLVSPFSETLPTALPLLTLRPDKEWLQKRSIGVQLQQVIGADSVGHQPDLPYYHFQPQLSFDLDEYTRFNTMEETIIEFIRRVIVRKIEGKRRLKVLKEGEKRFNQGNTLVLLDGIPLYDHEEILAYNPHLVKRIDIYSGRYAFGGETFECMVAFTTKRGNLTAIQLNEQSQLMVYECPQWAIPFPMPAYKDDAARKSRRPDFRHTLYWNPSVETTAGASPPQLSFYTSDLSGEYLVVAEGFTLQGEAIRGETRFRVK